MRHTAVGNVVKHRHIFGIEKIIHRREKKLSGGRAQGADLLWGRTCPGLPYTDIRSLHFKISPKPPHGRLAHSLTSDDKNIKSLGTMSVYAHGEGVTN